MDGRNLELIRGWWRKVNNVRMKKINYDGNETSITCTVCSFTIMLRLRCMWRFWRFVSTKKNCGRAPRSFSVWRHPGLRQNMSYLIQDDATHNVDRNKIFPHYIFKDVSLYRECCNSEHGPIYYIIDVIYERKKRSESIGNVYQRI